MKSNLLGITAMSATMLPFNEAISNAEESAKHSDNDKPNIVVIIADDLLSTEIGCYGGTNISTPNIDRIAREGVQFSNCYASEAMSVPIRASMYTGLYPAHHGSYQNHKDTYPGTKTVNWYMPQEGYRVGRTGKDHPGPKSVYVFDEIPGFTVNCTAREAPYSTDGIKEWMSRSNDPFLLYVCSINTHAPWTWGDPSEFDANKIQLPENCVHNAEMREIFTHYLAELRCLDNEVGSVMKTLEEIGKLDNTIVIFLGEQGPQFPGGKWTLWYPGCHSALLARYPSKIKAGSKCNAIVQYEDLLPTFIDIAGGQPRPELDGISFKDALFGKTNTIRKYAFGIHNNFPEGTPYPIRSIRDDRYALIMNLEPDSLYYEKHLMRPNSITGVWHAWEEGAKDDERNAFWLNRYVKRPAIEFYDLKKDPWEEHNLACEAKYSKKIAEMQKELLKWMDEQGDTGKSMDKRFRNVEDVIREKLNKRDRAVLVKEGWIRDPFIVKGNNGYFYLTGTTTNPGDPRENGELNTGLGEGSIVGNKVRVWRSLNLADWQDLGSVYEQPEDDSGKKNVLWAPEIQWTGKNWIMVHCPRYKSELLMTEGKDIRGPWNSVGGEDFKNMHDPSLFKDDDGTWYLVSGYHKYYVAPLKKDFSGFASKPVEISPSDRNIGHEGTTIKKIGKKYVFFGTAWSTDKGRKGSYNLYYCTSDNIYGPYSERRFVGRFLGHGTPFQDKGGKWWCTAFYNANVPPLDREGIQKRNLSETAQTINQSGTTLVPLDVKIEAAGDVTIRAIDPAYSQPGPDEIQKFINK